MLRQSIHALRTLRSVTETERLRIALAASGGLVYDWTPGDGAIQWSGNPAQAFGTAQAQIFERDHSFRTLIDPAGAKARAQLVTDPPPPDAPFCLEYRLMRAGAEPLWLEDRGACLLGPDGLVERVIGVIRDITARKKKEASLARLAHFDEATGHLTRNRLRERMDDVLNNGAARAETKAAYFVAAIDELAVLNEIYGIDAADEVISEIGQRLAQAAGPNAFIGRTAGNKFGVMLLECRPEDAARQAREMTRAAQHSIIQTRGGGVVASISVGGILLPMDAGTAPLAMARAEEALDRAKAQGRGGFALYEASAQRESNRRRAVGIGNQILSALEENRIKIAYQPIVDAKRNTISAYECLARIARPDGSLMAAGEFIEVAEQLGLVGLVDRRMLELSLQALNEAPELTLALNVSGMTASDRVALETFASILEANTAVAPRLIVELTETAALTAIEESVRFTARLHEIGAKVAIDDFGAGYTSFRNLQALRVDMVKIDGSFVRGLAQARDNQVFVRTLVDLARNFRLATVAEWVTNTHEADILTAVGVDYLQGFHFGKPEVTPPWQS